MAAQRPRKNRNEKQRADGANQAADTATTASAPAGTRRALLVANGKFQYFNHLLPGTAKDAMNLAAALSSPDRAGFEVTALVDEGFYAVRLAIAQACASSRPEDTLLFYYSGTSVVDSQGQLMLPVFDTSPDFLSATSIESEFILSQMRQSACRRFVLIIDGCHSGAFFHNNRGIPDGLIAMTSCSPEELSYDTPEGGAFTQSLLRALTDPAADRDQDGQITVDEAYDYVRRDLLASDYANHAQKWVWNLPEPIVLVRASARIFLSYSRSNGKEAKTLGDSLQNLGITVWQDVSGIPGGAQWRDSLVEALGKSDLLVFLMTEDSLASKWVRRELEFADGKGIPIVPVVMGEIAVPDWFSLQFGGVQQITLPARPTEAAAKALRDAIMKRLTAAR